MKCKVAHLAGMNALRCSASAELTGNIVPVSNVRSFRKSTFHSEARFPMFKERAPLVRHRAVVFTLSHVENDQFRVKRHPEEDSR